MALDARNPCAIPSPIDFHDVGREMPEMEKMGTMICVAFNRHTLSPRKSLNPSVGRSVVHAFRGKYLRGWHIL